MNLPPLICRPVLEHLATRYARRKAGRTGEGMQRVLFDYEAILKAAGCADGSDRVKAEEQLAEAARHGWIVLHRHRRDAALIHQVEFLPSGEASLFAALAAVTPAQLRESWAGLFKGLVPCPVAEGWREAWRDWCLKTAEGAARGQVPQPFRWEDVGEGVELLQIVSGVLQWKGESLIRFASCLLCNDSKRLEMLEPRIAKLLAQITGGSAGTLEAHGILRIPRTVLVHGPLRLEFPDGTLDLGMLRAPAWISEADILRATAVHSSAPRCLTVENETTMQELAKQQSTTLLVQTSYPSSAVLALLARLSAEMECWHFGDSDPWGFNILRDLRQRTRRTIRPLHMNFRRSEYDVPLSKEESRLLTKLLDDAAMADVHPDLTAIREAGSKGWFEQETLGFPKPEWPFYGQ